MPFLLSPRMKDVSVIMGDVVTFVIALLCIYPGIKLWRYGRAIDQLGISYSPMHLERALGEQRSFWKWAAISAMVVFVLDVLTWGASMVGIWHSDVPS